jgi:cytochrome c oxidase subunit IV
MYRTYWIAWGGLLALTLLMVVLDQTSLPPRSLVAVMLIAMTVKAGVIGAYFMHLRFERWPLVLSILLGLPINGAILYILIVPDALRIFEMLRLS